MDHLDTLCRIGPADVIANRVSHDHGLRDGRDRQVAVLFREVVQMGAEGIDCSRSRSSCNSASASHSRPRCSPSSARNSGVVIFYRACLTKLVWQLLDGVRQCALRFVAMSRLQRPNDFGLTCLVLAQIKWNARADDVASRRGAEGMFDFALPFLPGVPIVCTARTAGSA